MKEEETEREGEIEREGDRERINQIVLDEALKEESRVCQ
jgi:hypothetical protein